MWGLIPYEPKGSNQKGADCNGHGKHCAAIIGGMTYGIAKEATIYGARAVDCTGVGSTNGLLKIMDIIVNRQKEYGTGKSALVSMSVATEVHTSTTLLDFAIKGVTDTGIVVVSAAGNQADDSCKHHPASPLMDITVGVTDENGKVPSFSNTGGCTSIFVPRVTSKVPVTIVTTAPRTKLRTYMLNR